MATSRDLPAERLAVGQLLLRLLREFRRDLLSPAAEAGYGDVRDPHMQIFGNIGTGARLTEIASRAQLSLAATSELVNDLESLGYLRRRNDPTDGRAKLIEPTERGSRVLADAANRVADMERRWADVVGQERFDEMCRTMQELLDATDPGDARR
ncbi:MarR family winged helix-turn-helix transcriptional regulator [Aldersonia kunmingensis]|uniref:MarR family winged helix-turn-helix transcriptional regulator n=1 Tax=Aldersonia kunmingensis TaxID=408066 RepID=UPI00082B3537|nr:MarR family transcriptional regulator [Aldersonia kunmingensis]